LAHAEFIGGPCFVSTDRVEWTDFEQPAQLKLLAWLIESRWLDSWPAGDPERIGECLRQFGAITLPIPRPERFRLGPDGILVGLSGSVAAPDEVLAINRPKDSVCVDFVELGAELVKLRTGLDLANQMATGRTSWRTEILGSSGMFQGLERLIEIEGVPGKVPGDRATHLAQWWFSSMVGRHGLEVFPLPNGDKIGLSFRPLSVAQQLWLVLAATAGLLDVPFPVHGFHTCEYVKCGKPFFADRSKARGTHRFCSPEHGKSFHAVESMRKSRAKAKAASRFAGDE
jgi:hypothetical protein